MKNGTRNWVAKLKYPDHDPFFYGTIVTYQAKMHEVEAQLWTDWERHFPSSISRPKLLDIIPGMIVFHEETA